MNFTRTSGSFRMTCGTQIRRAHGRERIESLDSDKRYEISSRLQTEPEGSGIETEEVSRSIAQEGRTKGKERLVRTFGPF